MKYYFLTYLEQIEKIRKEISINFQSVFHFNEAVSALDGDTGPGW